MRQAAPRLAESEGEGRSPPPGSRGDSRPALSLGDEVTCQADPLSSSPRHWVVLLAGSMRAVGAGVLFLI